MNRILMIFISLIILTSCKNENNYEDKDELCKILGEITADDQKYRGMPQMIDPFFRILDSLRTTNNISYEEYKGLTQKEQLEWKKKARAIANNVPQVSKQIQDSLMNLQIEIDNRNTELLMDIIRKKGWVYKNELGCKEYVSAWIVFRHSQEKYWDGIREIIEKEKLAKRIGNGDYMMIDNHIKGRPSFNLDDVLIQ